MHLINHPEFLGWLWRTSLQACIVVVLVLLAQWIFRKQLPPSWRHALWLLVLVRLLLPGSLSTSISVFNWVTPSGVNFTGDAAASVAAQEIPREIREAPLARGANPSLKLGRIAGGIWVAGAAVLALYLTATALRFSWLIRRHRPVTNSDVLNLLEDCKQSMGVHTPVSLVETSMVQSPALLGFIRPRLLLPKGLLDSFSIGELRHVLLHELAHVKRGDIPLNWISILPLVLHWFNPLVWYAFWRMRADAEVACDALALSCAELPENKSYGATIIKLLENFSRPGVAPGLVGLLETQNQMKRRIIMIRSFTKTRGVTIVGAALFVGLGLATLTDSQTTRAAESSTTPERGGPPRIVKSTPAPGDTEIDPSLKEITVTFDRDMESGFSWTGGGPEYPASPKGQKPRWVDKRTCALPVELQPARYYRVGINSTSYQNFKSAEGVPAQPSAIYFTTKGASEELKRKASKPMIVGLTPKNGATDVDPKLSEIRVTFNVPMGGGFSWTGGGEQYPTIPDGKRPSWTADKKTCILPVQLEPGREYRLGLNSPSHKNFQSEGGVPLEPIVLTFRTKTN